MSVRVLLAPGLVIAIVAASGAGCASPHEHYYSLMPDVVNAARTQPESAVAVAVASVTVPEAVNRPQLVIGSGERARVLLEQERWIEPVAEDLQRAIAQHLASRLVDMHVLIGGERGADVAAFKVFVQVRRLEMSPDSGARLDAHWLILGRSSEPVREGEFFTSVPATVKGYAALVRAQSAAVGSLAAQIAIALQGLAPPQVAGGAAAKSPTSAL